jgi:cyclopropane fatty-acyl-phospholipid synthase-like methyltransferase
MRTAADFNEFYKVDDPWSLTRAKFRDRVFRKLTSSLVRGRSVLELGCGEGHLTQEVFARARSIVGIDISDIAIERAKKRGLENAQFRSGDILEADFTGHDLITAIECIYYLSPDEQERLFVKIAKEHPGKMLLLSAPIVGENRFRRYFTHAELMAAFKHHDMTVVSFHNLNVYRWGFLRTAAAVAVRLVPSLLDVLPDAFVYQRLYKIRTM